MEEDTLDLSERIAVEGAAHARTAGLHAEPEVVSDVAHVAAGLTRHDDESADS